MTRSGPAVCRPSRTPQGYQSWDQQHSRWVLLPVLGLVALAVPGLIVLGLISTNIGVGAVLVGAMAAVLPVILVFAAFLWGAGVSVLGAAIVNDTATVLGEQVLGNGGGDLVGTVISAPIAEEAFKGAFLIGLLLLRRREFDGVVDGVVYAGLVAAGFAFTENILYFGRAFATDGLVGEGGSVLVVFIIRGILSPFAHPVFTAMIGIAVGLAVRRRNLFGWVLVPLVGYVPAVVLHALWNASASLGFLPGFYAVIMVPLFGGLIALVLWQRRREQRVVAGQLAGFASAGWIAPTEVPLLASLAGRRGWRSEERRRAGEQAADAVRDYQNAVTELAFLSDRMQRGSVGSETGRWHHDTLAALMAARERTVRAPQGLSSASMLEPASSSWGSVGEAAHLERREPLQQG